MNGVEVNEIKCITYVILFFQGFQLLGFEAVELSSESLPPPSPPLSPVLSSIIVEDYLSDEASETAFNVILVDTSTTSMKESIIEAEKPVDSPTWKPNHEAKSSDASVEVPTY